MRGIKFVCKCQLSDLHIYLCAGEAEDCDKVGREESGLTIQQLDPLPINGFTLNHNGKVNGYVPHPINITNNPLAESHQGKVMYNFTFSQFVKYFLFIHICTNSWPISQQ